MDNTRRASWSSNDEQAPIPHSVNGNLPHQYYTPLPYIPVHAAQTQHYIAGPIQPMKCTDNKSYEMVNLDTDKSTNKLFPRHAGHDDYAASEMTGSSIIPIAAPVNSVIAGFRYIFYRPLPEIRIKRGWRPIVFPSLAVICVCSAALIFVILYCFVPKPLYWQSIRFGSPPLAIRSGRHLHASMPWNHRKSLMQDSRHSPPRFYQASSRRSSLAYKDLMESWSSCRHT